MTTQNLHNLKNGHRNGSNSNNSSSSSSSSSSNNDDRSAKLHQRRARKAPHELLTESEKKANHIASEQRRRQNIRLGFEQLVDVVPTLSEGSRSEAVILQKSVEHIRQLIAVKDDLEQQVRDLQLLLGEKDFYDDD